MGRYGSVGQDLFSLPSTQTYFSGRLAKPLDTLLGTQWRMCSTSKYLKRKRVNHVQWRTKILGTGMENLAFTSLTYQLIGSSIIICTSLNTSILRKALPSPPPNNVGMRKCFQDRLKCTGLHKLHSGAVLWNSLPSAARQATSLTSFRRLLINSDTAFM